MANIQFLHVSKGGLNLHQSFWNFTWLFLNIFNTFWSLLQSCWCNFFFFRSALVSNLNNEVENNKCNLTNEDHNILNQNEILNKLANEFTERACRACNVAVYYITYLNLLVMTHQFGINMTYKLNYRPLRPIRNYNCSQLIYTRMGEFTAWRDYIPQKRRPYCGNKGKYSGPLNKQSIFPNNA